MKIFISQHPSLKVQGLAHAIKNIVPTSFFWSKNDVSLFDLIENQQPDIIFYHDADATDKGIELAKQEYPNIKFVFMQFLPTLSLAKPDLTITMASDLPVHGPSLSLDFQTNTASMEGGQARDKYETDILVLTDHIDPQDDFQILTMRTLSHTYRTKIYGDIKVPVPNYLGKLRPTDYKDVLSSAKVLVSFDTHQCNNAR
jgi:hypothetical protein